MSGHLTRRDKLIMKQHFLEKFANSGSGMEFWWDSSPLIFDSWKKNFLSKLDRTKRSLYLNFFNNLISESNPESQFFLGSTTNPILAWQAILADRDRWYKVLGSKKREYGASAEGLFWALYVEIARLGAEKFLPLYESSGKKYGYISVQMDIRDMDNIGTMIEKAEELADLIPNIMIKVPGTSAGYKVIEKLTQKGISTNSTLSFVYPQLLDCANSVKRGYDAAISRGIDMKGWRSVITHMEGRFGEAFEGQAKTQGIYLNEGELRLAELAIFKKAYQVIKSKHIPTKLLSCSLRVGPTVNGKTYVWNLEHKREGDVVVTCPPSLLEQLTLLELEYVGDTSINDQIPTHTMEKLLRIVGFVASYNENGYAPEEYSLLAAFEKARSEHLHATMEILKFVS